MNHSPLTKMIRNIRALIRALAFGLTALTYFIVTPLLYPYFLINPMGARRIIRKIVSKFANFTRWFMGIRVNRIIDEDISGDEAYLIVSNHLSYTDMLAITSYYPCCFVTSVEMKNIPFLGQICILAGCVFVERRNKKNLGAEVQEITDALKSGLSVVIFPEATSTNGEEVIRFRRPLFRSALDSKVNVKPLTINYRTIEGEPVSLKNRDSVFWYGDMTFADHLWGVFKSKYIEVDLSVGKSIETNGFEEPGLLAEKSHDVVSGRYDKVTT